MSRKSDCHCQAPGFSAFSLALCSLAWPSGQLPVLRAWCTVSWWWPELDSLHTCFSRTAFGRYSGLLPFSYPRVMCLNGTSSVSLWIVVSWGLRNGGKAKQNHAPNVQRASQRHSCWTFWYSISSSVVVSTQGCTFWTYLYWKLGFPSGSAVKKGPVMPEQQEVWVSSLGGEYPLEEGMVPHSIILA